MSLIIHKPQSKIISKEILEKCFRNNSDGAGFCFSYENQLVIRNKFKTFEGFYKEYLPVENCSCLINFAEKDFPVGAKKYCGPYELDKNHALVHVGDIWKTESLVNKEESQTANLVKFLRENIWNPNYFGKLYLKWIIQESFDSDNLIVIMNNLGEVQIFNENKGTVFDSVWYSESHYKYNNFKSSFTPRGPSLTSPQINHQFEYLKQDNSTVPSCNLCKGKCYTNPIKRNGFTYCPKCYSSNYKTLNFPDGSPTGLGKNKLNVLLKDVIPEPELLDIFDLI